MPLTPIAIKAYKGTIDAPAESGALPSFNLLQNTIGNIVWTKPETGRFIGTLTGAFPEGKTWTLPGGNANGLMLGIGYSLPFDHGYTITRQNNNTIWLIFNKTSDYSQIDPYDIISSGKGNGVPFEILVFN